jgi:type I restriction enzyme M protein
LAGFDKVNAASVKERIKEIGRDASAGDELAVLKQWQQLAADEAALKRQLKDADAALDAMAYARYPRLTEDEVKSMVVDDKWLGALDAAIHSEVDRVSRTLTQRVKELADRYGTPLPRLVENVDALEGKVREHLAAMGFAWR